MAFPSLPPCRRGHRTESPPWECACKGRSLSQASTLSHGAFFFLLLAEIRHNPQRRQALEGGRSLGF